jgi:RimJ/RimL family protein N-acetyltransferase
MREIVTERLLINNFTLQDMNNLYELIQDYQKSRYYKFDHKWPEAFSAYEKIITWFSSEDTYLAVRKKEENMFIGFINLTKEDEENGNIFNLGCVFNSKYHNKGYATEACLAYMNYIRLTYSNVQFVSGTAKDNIPANRLLKTLGFMINIENKSSFQDDDKNIPIVFEGYEYRLVPK